MAETKHAPGPWEASKSMQDGRGVYGIEIGAETPAGHMSVAWVLLGEKPTSLEMKDGAADARLIAAAPELLEALRPLAAWAALRPDGASDDEAILHAAGTWPITWGDATRAAAAIAKAEGRADG